MAKKQPRKFIFVVGGVMSSVGKGVASASMGKILQSKGYRVSNVKCDMYVNIDAGTIRPAEHGEVFVGEDGVEADQDLGNYERFTDQISTRDHYITTGQVYQEVIRRERALEYNGEDVEVVPDVPKEIIRRIMQAQKKDNAEITIIEFGGTVGEYQVLLFLEAARMMKLQFPKDVLFVMVSYLPTPPLLGEQKSKPTQHAIRTLNSAGIAPDFVFCRAEKPVEQNIKNTISNICSLQVNRIISSPNVHSIYDVPVVYEKEHLGRELLKAMDLRQRKTNMQDWVKLSNKIKDIKKEVTIGIVGKYFNFKSCKDTYLSVIESIQHAAWSHNVEPKILWLDSEEYETNSKKLKELKNVDGIIVPGGFGTRGVEGIISAIQFAREHNIPYLGLCYGMQLASVEFVRNVLGKKQATTVEMNPQTKEPVIHINPNQAKNVEAKNYGGTMRLGAYDCVLRKGTKVFDAYKTGTISERHRHRYEFNNDYREAVDKAGLKIVGLNPESDLVEIVELENHPFFVGVQFHPEFKSRPMKPHPLFRDFVKASLKRHDA